jgi:peptidoglycan/LPS O-acetylase OafA/YrhL
LSASAITTISRVPPPSVRWVNGGAKAETGQRFYRPELDVLRFVAFLCVFLHHGIPSFEPRNHSGVIRLLVDCEAAVKTAGGFGVCLFFLLSSYLITELLLKEQARTGKVRVFSFYIRRALRIWPLYFVFLAFAFALGLFVPACRIEPKRLLAFLLFSGNWYVAAATCGASSIAPLWSISLEEQFYVIWPFLARFGGKRVLFVVSVLLLPVSSTIAFLMARKALHPDPTIWVNSFVQFQFFAAGALLAITLSGKTPKLLARSRALLFGTGALLWILAAGVFRIKDALQNTSPISIVMGYFCVLLGCVLFFFGFLGITRKFSPKLVYFGRISYGLYVFHMSLLFAAWKLFGAGTLFDSTGAGRVANLTLPPLLALGATVGVAVLSYKFLETPFLRLKERFAVVQSREI